MVRSMLPCRPKSRAEMVRITESCIEAINELYGKAAEDCLHEEIDSLFRKKEHGWQLLVMEKMLNGEHGEAKETDEGLCVLKELCVFCRESEEMLVFLSSFSAVKELLCVYQRTVFGLHRMEIGLPKEECSDFLAWMKERRIPPEFIIMVLRMADVFAGAAGIRLIALLREDCREQYAEVIERWLLGEIEKEKAARG